VEPDRSTTDESERAERLTDSEALRPGLGDPSRIRDRWSRRFDRSPSPATDRVRGD
jgi:hypothetical protein